MESTWQRFNHRWIIPFFSALTLIRRPLTRPLARKIARVRNQLRLEHPLNMRFEQRLAHWNFLRSRRLYECGVHRGGLQGISSAFLRSANAEATAGATLRQTIKANAYRGKRLCFSGNMKAEQVEQRAALYIHTNRDQRLQVDECELQGTHDWTRYEATISIPEDALFISFGCALHGKGRLWLANTSLEVIA
ncbi:hypothetical protein EPA93_05885 [Ktedonosporobacter rubrisoli]|uniref:Uncharacterized protein n=1 Tax=Ktedonosporobacter rubrisoli TaxID=2509675 RepID=A0A4P6JK78_KTERU|nr:hypothetical protein [Ktedonosporobacter rubrisoli]QBD75558.1 hypothetical protein EPA93_05885 [Ktedonosporobacter rubrisoli]